MNRGIVNAVLVSMSWLLLLPGVSPVGARATAGSCASSVWLDTLPGTPAPLETASPPGREAAAWMTTELIDACTGTPFSLADFAGKTMYIESMATWCGECYEQLTRATEAAKRIPATEREGTVFIALSSEIDLSRDDLAAYAAKTAFPMIFAVMPEAMLKAMVEDLGREVAIPPATPHLIVAPNGTIGALHTGGSSPEELLALLDDAREAPSP